MQWRSDNGVYSGGLHDGIIGPFGLSFRINVDEASTIIFSLKDAFTTGAGFDIYTLTDDLGGDIILGENELGSVGSPPNRSSFFRGTLVNQGDNSGIPGNPFLLRDMPPPSAPSGQMMNTTTILRCHGSNIFFRKRLQRA